MTINITLWGYIGAKVYVKTDQYTSTRIVISHGLYGLKHSVTSFHDFFSKRLRNTNFRNYTRYMVIYIDDVITNFDFWYYDKSDYYKYVVIYIDDVIIFSKNHIDIIAKIQKKNIL